MLQSALTKRLFEGFSFLAVTGCLWSFVFVLRINGQGTPGLSGLSTFRPEFAAEIIFFGKGDIQQNVFR